MFYFCGEYSMDVSVIIRCSVIFHVISLLPKQRSYCGFVVEQRNGLRSSVNSAQVQFVDTENKNQNDAKETGNIK